MPKVWQLADYANGIKSKVLVPLPQTILTIKEKVIGRTQKMQPKSCTIQK
jgi:hypothetical protein